MCNINPLCNYFQVNISQSQQAKSPTNYWIISLSDALSVRNLKTVPDSVVHAQQAQCWWAVSCWQKAKLNLLKCIHPKYGGVEECRHKFHPVQIVILGSGSSPLGWIPARHGTARHSSAAERIPWCRTERLSEQRYHANNRPKGSRPQMWTLMILSVGDLS